MCHCREASVETTHVRWHSSMCLDTSRTHEWLEVDPPDLLNERPLNEPVTPDLTTRLEHDSLHAISGKDT